MQFPATVVGGASKAVTIQFVNGCRRGANVRALSVGGMNPDDFPLLSLRDLGGSDLQFPGLLPSMFAFTGDVQFAPRAAGQRLATLEVNEGGAKHPVTQLAGVGQ